MHKTPSEYARWVRRVHELSHDGELDVRDLVERCGGRVDEFPIHGFAGLLLPLGDGFFGIALREGDSEKRKRFTIAHELGHFCIPSHRDRAALCVAPDLSQDGSNKLAEREASEFAAELLMPRRVIESIVATGSIDIARALTISARFNVSLVSAAIRMCECGFSKLCHASSLNSVTLGEGG